MQPLGWRWPRIGLEGEQVGDGCAGRRKVEIGGVNHLRRERTAASHANGLGSVMPLLAASMPSRARLCAAKIICARQFVSGVVDNFVGAQLRRGVGAQTVDLTRNNHDHRQKERLQQKRSQHSPVGENSSLCFTCESRA